MDRAEYIWRWLWERIGNAYGAAGLMGNLEAESGLNPENLQNSYERKWGITDREYVERVDSGEYGADEFALDGAGFGIAQWTSPNRKAELLKYAHGIGKSIGNLDAQLEFLWKEISGYAGTVNTLFNAKTVKEASDAVLLEYERPADKSEENREARASRGQRFYDLYAVKDTKRELTIYRRLFYDSECYDAATKIIPAGVQVHSTGANNPWLKRYVQPDDGRIGVNTNGNSHNRPGVMECGSAYIGRQMNGNVAVYQALPFDYKCWLSGSGKNGNANTMGYLGFEICEDNEANRDRAYFEDAVMNKSVLLTAYWCQEYGIDVDEAVRDHAELHAAGLASNHKDIGHWLAAFGLNMNDYRQAVKDALADGIRVKYIDCDEVVGLYKAKAVNPGRYLNLRSGPGTKYASIAQIPQGDIVTVLDDTNAEWWYVQYESKKGYAMSQYLERIDEPGPGPEPEPPKEMIEIPRETAMLWRDFARTMADTLDEQLGMTVDCRSGNVSSIDYQ